MYNVFSFVYLLLYSSLPRVAQRKFPWCGAAGTRRWHSCWGASCRCSTVTSCTCVWGWLLRGTTRATLTPSSSTPPHQRYLTCTPSLTSYWTWRWVYSELVLDMEVGLQWAGAGHGCEWVKASAISDTGITVVDVVPSLKPTLTCSEGRIILQNY